MRHRESKPMTELVKTVIRRQPVYTFPNVAHAQLQAQLDAAMAALHWDQQTYSAPRRRR
jgi:hypothetical protein